MSKQFDKNSIILFKNYMFNIFYNSTELFNKYMIPTNKKGDSGFNLLFPNDIELWPGLTTVDLDVSIRIYKNEIEKKRITYKIYPRSSISKYPGLILQNSVGIIDSEYNGSLKVPIYNMSKEMYIFTKFDSLFQIIIDNTEILYLNGEDRNDGGFGSTNI